jgi:hypothetical protein
MDQSFNRMLKLNPPVNLDDEFDLPSPAWGDEFEPPEPEIDIREAMLKDERIYENPKPVSSISIQQGNRPLYRPTTAFNLASSKSSPLESPTKPFEAPRYDWMKRSLQPENRFTLTNDKNSQTQPVISQPSPKQTKMTTTTLDLDPSAIQRSRGVYIDGKTQMERNTGNINVKTAKTKTKVPARDQPSRKSEEGSSGRQSLSEFDFLVDGLGYSVGAGVNERPSTAKPLRPSSAGTARRPSTGFQRTTSGKIGTTQPAEDLEAQKFEDRMRRDLKRGEKELTFKEAALKKQLRKYGANLDEYDSYHHV